VETWQVETSMASKRHEFRRKVEKNGKRQTRQGGGQPVGTFGVLDRRGLTVVHLLVLMNLRNSLIACNLHNRQLVRD
jgi:hypothetical protein